MKKIILVLFLFGIILPSAAQKSIRIDSVKINSVVKKLKDSLNIPGIAVEIAIGNEIKYKNVCGYKDIETKTELTDSSIWQICSITKQFTTVACFKLIEEGKLSLQDKISKYLNNLPESYRNITVHHLLTMTSGIKDYINEEMLYGSTWENVKEKVFSDSLNFKSGEAWSYSNTGFWIAAKIIESITKLDFNQYLEQNFFTKLQMTNTHRFSFATNRDFFVKGYEYRDNQYFPPELDITKFQGQGDGELISTLSDMLKWNRALANGEIINKEFVSRMWTRSKLNNDDVIEVSPNSGMNYGMGWFIKDIGDKKIVWTPGSGFGFSTTSQYMPDYDMTILVFCNKMQFLMADEIGFEIIKKVIQ
jgi:CubicO group peptidase (beta-lactamase class C family)